MFLFALMFFSLLKYVYSVNIFNIFMVNVMAKEINLMSNQFFQTKLNHIKPASAFVAGSTIVLNDLLNTTSGIEGVLLITSDGFEICSVFENHDKYRTVK